MDAAASIITVVATSVSLAQYIKQLINDVKQQDANAKELEDRLDTLTRALGEANSAYGPRENPTSSAEEQLRRDVGQIVIDYKCDLEKVGIELKKQINHKNWLSLSWRRQYAAPILARIDKSISERQQQLGFLVQLLQGQELRDMKIKLELLTKIYYPDYPLSITTTGESDTISEASPDTALSGKHSLGSRGYLETLEDVGIQDNRESNNANGALLLKAIREKDDDNFELLFQNGDTSFQEQDDKDRTPLLLAAHLDMKNWVNRFLSDQNLFSPSPHAVSERRAKTKNHREVDINATDTLGRSTLHYCAEFGMCDEATILLDHGVNVNARDKSNCPPAYYAAKEHKFDVSKLLVERGADAEFEHESTSPEIDQLLEKAIEEG